jgi:hypothetical protein
MTVLYAVVSNFQSIMYSQLKCLDTNNKVQQYSKMQQMELNRLRSILQFYVKYGTQILSIKKLV